MSFPILPAGLLLCLCVSTVRAGEEPTAWPDEYPATGAPEAGTMFFDMRATAAADDFQLGGRVGLGTLTRIGLDFFLDFETRPYRRAVRVRESDALHYQFREDRLTIGPGLLARFPLGSEGMVIAAGGGGALSFGDYRGTRRDAPFKALPWLEAGVRFGSGSGVDWGFSYQYFPLPGVSPHRGGIHLGFRLGGM